MRHRFFRFNFYPLQVLVPVANGSEEIEALYLIDVLRRAGANVVVASVEDKLQIVTRRHKFNLIADMMLDEAVKMEFDLIVMPVHSFKLFFYLHSATFKNASLTLLFVHTGWSTRCSKIC
jgi:putative intracellular protease/amidase